MANLKDLKERMEVFIHDPARMSGEIMDYLTQVYDDDIDIVDPTHPFPYLIESSVISTTLAVEDHIRALNDFYPVLARDEKSLYRHMSDLDFLDRFSQPSRAIFHVALQRSSFDREAISVPDNNYRKLTIPRGTEVTLGDVRFTLNYPVEITEFSNGNINVFYNVTDPSPIDPISSNVIPHRISNPVPEEGEVAEEWIMFDLPLMQVIKTTEYFPITLSSALEESVEFEDDYFHARVYHKSTAGIWEEIKTSHSDQVFNHREPTALLEVYSNSVKVTIPPIYSLTGLIGKELRVSVYSTKGEVSIDFNSFSFREFESTLKPSRGEEVELDQYASAFGLSSYIIFSDQKTYGGRASLTFQELQERMLENNVGIHRSPITSNNLTAYSEDHGMTIYKDKDYVLDRLFIASNTLLVPVDLPFNTPINSSPGTLITTPSELSLSSSVRRSGTRTTILEKSLFGSDGNVIRLLSDQESNDIKSLGTDQLISLLNTSEYRFTPFTYVIDQGVSTKIRAYEVTRPKILNIDFVSHNASSGYYINTDDTSMEFTERGYLLRIITKSNKDIKELPTSDINATLAIKATNDRQIINIEGTLEGTTDAGEFIFAFELHTLFDINDKDELMLTDLKLFDDLDSEKTINITHGINIIYSTSSEPTGFIPLDDLLDSDLEYYSVTTELLTIKFCDRLTHLWNKSNNIPGQAKYKLHTDNIPFIHTQDALVPSTNGSSPIVIDEETCGISYELLAKAGSPMTDGAGNVLYRHRIGDPVIGDDGFPIEVESASIEIIMELLVFDAKFLFATSSTIQDYLNDVKDYIITNSTLIMENIRDTLIEKTDMKYLPVINQGRVTSDDLSTDLDTEIYFNVTLRVEKSIFENDKARSSIEKLTVNTINSSLSSNTVSIDILHDKLKEAYGDSVISVNIGNTLVPGKEIDIITLDNSKLSIPKRISKSDDGELIVTDDIDFNFVNYLDK